MFSSYPTSLALSLLFVSTAEWRPLSIHDTTYFVGEKWRRGGQTTRTNKSAETVVVERDALVEVRMGFIWENPSSHSLEEIVTAWKAFFKSTKFSENIFWFK
jgi:hypothetical protein